MVDFAHTALGETAPLPIYVDDEGTLCEDAVLIKDGILVGYMNSRDCESFWNEACGKCPCISLLG